MDNISTIALARMTAQQRTLDVIANNLANADTPGFRAERVQFGDWLLRETDTTAPAGARTITLPQDRATWQEQQPGALSHTGNPLDLALGEQGYFTVATPSGPRLTRAGRFSVNASGTIIDSAGNNLLDSRGAPLVVPATDTQIEVATDGTISTESGPVGRVGVVQPNDPMRLLAEGGHDLRAESDTTPVPTPQITQGMLEESNVQPMLETTRMIDLQRQFEFTAQMVQSESDRQQSTIDKLTPHAG